MSRRLASGVAWSLFATCLAGSTIGVLLFSRVPASALERSGGSLIVSVTFAGVLLVFAAVGAVVAARVPANPVGWLFLALALVEAAYELANGYAQFSLTVSSLPATAYAAWFANWSTPVSPTLLALAFLLFPDGRLVSRRWAPVVWLCLLAIVPVVARYALAPGGLQEFPSVDNPFGLTGAAFLGEVDTDPFVLPIIGCAVLAVLVRFHRSRGAQRQQLKWFAWSAGLMAAYIVAGLVVRAATGGDDEGTAAYVAGFVFAVILCGLPVSAGVAILRYRLYDIDLVINRTLVYGALTAALVLTYLGSVLLFRLALDPLTGDSQLAVAGSTLAVAALFRPMRWRIQAIVDRRFYRSRYDAARTSESFAGRLRDELDLEALGLDLRTVVGQTLQPAHVSLWLRDVPGAHV